MARQTATGTMSARNPSLAAVVHASPVMRAHVNMWPALPALLSRSWASRNSLTRWWPTSPFSDQGRDRLPPKGGVSSTGTTVGMRRPIPEMPSSRRVAVHPRAANTSRPSTVPLTWTWPVYLPLATSTFWHSTCAPTDADATNWTVDHSAGLPLAISIAANAADRPVPPNRAPSGRQRWGARVNRASVASALVGLSPSRRVSTPIGSVVSLRAGSNVKPELLEGQRRLPSAIVSFVDAGPQWPCMAATRSGTRLAAFGVPRPVTGSHPVVAL